MKQLTKYAVLVVLIAVIALAAALPVAGAKTTKGLKNGKCQSVLNYDGNFAVAGR